MKLKAYLFTLLLCITVSVMAKEWKASDIPMVHLQDARRYVCDPDNILNPALRDSTDTYLSKLDKECGIESVFVIVNNVENADVFRIAQDLGNKVGVGDKKTNRGLVVVVAVNDRKYFIAPGEGLEKDLTDVDCDDIARACIVQNMRTGNPDAAMLTTAKVVYRKLKTGATGLKSSSQSDEGNVRLGIFFLVIAIVVIGIYAQGKDNGKNNGKKGGNRGRNIGGTPFIWGNPGHINDSSFGGGSFGGGSFGGGGAGGGW